MLRRIAGGALLVGSALTLALLGAGAAAAGPAQAADRTTPRTTPVAAPSGALAAATDTLTFTGHGWGHGRGMGQYGALGYAVDYGWDYRRILGYYYGNTSEGNVGNPEIAVELTEYTGRDQVVVYADDLSVGGAPWTASDYVVLRVAADNTVLVSPAASCAGPETGAPVPFPVGTRVGTQAVTTYESLVRVCESADATRAYRGAFSVQRYGAMPQLSLFNQVALDDYLMGVVPRESPASWGDLVRTGSGMEALKAQAVAARSYAFAGSKRASGARTCDTTACQVYGGAAHWPPLPPNKTNAVLEAAKTNEAVRLTAGQVRVFSTGAVARTEFSSSTGGYTVGGAFPAVPDEGDAVRENPYHTWDVTLSTADVAARLGLSGVRSVTVTGRNGLGDWGGRVTSVAVVDGAGVTRSYTGAAFRSAMGTDRFKSDWFTIGGSTTRQAEAVVRALYQDVLGREPDPVGLAGWTQSVMATGNPQVVTNGIVYSRERLATMIAAEYRAALRRDPEPGGLLNWTLYLERGAGVSDLQVGIYASQESLQVLGGGDTPTWVGAMYAGLLGRAASASEKAEWTQVAATRGRAAAVAGIAKSDEAGLARLSMYYRRYLGRELDPTGAATWLPYMRGAGDFQVPGFIGGSAEYWARAQTRFP